MNFGNILNKVEDLGDISKNIPLNELLTNEFISKYTNFTTQDEFKGKLNEEADVNVETLDGVKEMDKGKLNGFVERFTEFNDWKSMLIKAVQLYMAHKK
ncbi:hypothetical protein V1502_14180 [Bacillus sp. SCS-153A]|uniref:hypothetical protein n=1 Tax=Rossellomorea sedimentorum TaxID=3115294 RepID=UPI0039066062